MSQTIRVINRSGACYFYTHQTNDACAGMCVCNRTHQMEITALLWKVQISLKYSIRDFAFSKVSEWKMMLKNSLYLIFVLQIYRSMESIKEEEDFLGVICDLYNQLLTISGFIFVLLFGKKSSCNHGKLTFFKSLQVTQFFL